MNHQFRLHGYNIVLDVPSGAVHTVDDLTYDLLEQLDDPPVDTLSNNVLESLSKQYDTAEILEAYGELQTLYREDLLWSIDDFDLTNLSLGLAPIKAMCLHIAHDCNLRCRYCFASTGDFNQGRTLLSLETGKQAIDFLIANSAHRRNLEVDFFGGEPLMNFSVVKEIVDYARAQEKIHHKNFRFTITTNGVLLDEATIDYLSKEMYNIVLSLDGRQEINDALRPAINGKGSYHTIVPKYQSLVKKREKQKPNGNWQYYVRGTFTKKNLDFTQDFLHLQQLGFKEISLEPVVGETAPDYAITDADLPRVLKEYERLACTLLEKQKHGEDVRFFHFLVDLEQGPCAIKRLRGCGSGNEYVAITPDGEIYPCHQFVGMQDWKMGDLSNGKLDLEIKEKFANLTVYDKELCKQCFARFYCSGGCHANHVQQNGDLHLPTKVSCEMQKKRLECALMMQVAMAEHLANMSQ